MTRLRLLVMIRLRMLVVIRLRMLVMIRLRTLIEFILPFMQYMVINIYYSVPCT